MQIVAVSSSSFIFSFLETVSDEVTKFFAIMASESVFIWCPTSNPRSANVWTTIKFVGTIRLASIVTSSRGMGWLPSLHPVSIVLPSMIRGSIILPLSITLIILVTLKVSITLQSAGSSLSMGGSHFWFVSHFPTLGLCY